MAAPGIDPAMLAMMEQIQQQNTLMMSMPQASKPASTAKVDFPTFDPAKESFATYRMHANAVLSIYFPYCHGQMTTTTANATKSLTLQACLLTVLLPTIVEMFQDNAAYVGCGVEMWALICDPQESTPARPSF